MRLDRILRYPIKSLSVESLTHADLTPGQGLPYDRKWALARPDGEAANNTDWHPKSNFLVLARDYDIAQVKSHFDELSGRLSFEAPNELHGEGLLSTEQGRAAIAGGIAKHLGLDDSGTPILVEAKDIGYFDTTEGPVSLLNMASVRDLEKVMGQNIDPVRFRMNLILEDLEPWTERDWVGKRIKIGDVILDVSQDTGRCIATHINPDSGEKDAKVLHALKDNFGHTNMGIYAKVVEGGTIRPGDCVNLLDT
ncbi:MOSC domain-containing protein [Magnetovibrio sp. PR-2]|uniref:MOSC domain-containing protein n=1 Tax=Magnetovibrio sp. PR-2 TaxID=3120356 RepID=UPI002FCE5F1F